MITSPLTELFVRDLNRLKAEIQEYKSEENLWKVEHSIKNSGGNLCLHLIGNLKTFIGNGFGDLGYIRKRDFEFAGKNVPRTQLYQEIDETIEIVQHALAQIKEAEISNNFPIVIWKEETGMAFTLLHLYGHFNYHLGQINYHRRLLDEQTVI